MAGKRGENCNTTKEHKGTLPYSVQPILVYYCDLTHWGQVNKCIYMRQCIRPSLMPIIGWWLVTCSAPSHYLQSCWRIINFIPSIKLKRNLSRNSTIFIQQNEYERFVCKMAAILSRPQFVDIYNIILRKTGRRQRLTTQTLNYDTTTKGVLRWYWETSGPVFYLLLGVSSDYAQPITGQVTEVTCPVIGWAQPELTPSKRQKTGPGLSAVLGE